MFVSISGKITYAATDLSQLTYSWSTVDEFGITAGIMANPPGNTNPLVTTVSFLVRAPRPIRL